MKLLPYISIGALGAAALWAIYPRFSAESLSSALGVASLLTATAGLLFSGINKNLQEVEKLEVQTQAQELRLQEVCRRRRRKLHIKFFAVVLCGVLAAIIGWGTKALPSPTTNHAQQLLTVGYGLLSVALCGLGLLLIEHLALENLLGELRQRLKDKKKRDETIRSLHAITQDEASDTG